MYYTERKLKNKKKRVSPGTGVGGILSMLVCMRIPIFDMLGVMHVTLACFFSLELFSLIIVKDM